MRVIAAVELVACHVFNLAEQTRQRLTFGGVERYLAQLAAHPGDCGCGPCVLAPGGAPDSGSVRSPAPAAPGASYAMIVRALGEDNAELDKCDRVTIDSVSNHCGRHFPVQNVAKATYREILERRAKENGVDFVEGVATAITPIAFFESVMVKSYETLVDSDTKVDVNTGIDRGGTASVADRPRDVQPRCR